MNKIDEKAKKLIEENFNMINNVAGFMMIKFHGLVNKDDMLEFGISGLIDAAIKFNPSKNENFKKYAITRIKGSILDGIRKLDYMPRNTREISTKIERAYLNLEQKLNRMPEDIEVAQELGVSLNEFNYMLYKIRGASFLSKMDFVGKSSNFAESVENIEGNEPAPIDDLVGEEKKQILRKYIDTLDVIEKNILMMYYYDELTLKEIGSMLNLTESRICQIHSKAIIKLRAKLRSYE